MLRFKFFDNSKAILTHENKCKDYQAPILSQTKHFEAALIEKFFFDAFCHVDYDTEMNVEDAAEGETLISKEFSFKGVK